MMGWTKLARFVTSSESESWPGETGQWSRSIGSNKNQSEFRWSATNWHENHREAGASLRGDTIPADHGYALLRAISRHVPSIHGDATIGVHPIHGRLVGDRRLALTPAS